MRRQSRGGTMMAPKKEKIRGLREFTETCLAFSGLCFRLCPPPHVHDPAHPLWPPPTNALVRARAHTHTHARADTHSHTHAAQSSSWVVASAHLSYVCAVSDETATVAMKTAATVRDNMVKAEKAMVLCLCMSACPYVCVCVCARARVGVTKFRLAGNATVRIFSSLAWPRRGTHAHEHAQVVNGWGQYELQTLWKEMLDMGSGKCPAVPTLAPLPATTPHAVTGG